MDDDSAPKSNAPRLGRRKFIASASALTGYGLLVKAPQSLASEQDGFVRRTEVGQRIDELAPEGIKPGAASADPNMRVVELQADVLVAGGGLAGICAAISAARLGSKVVLVQDRSRLGGNASSEVKMHPRGSRFGFREGGIVEEICLDHGYQNGQYSWEVWDLILYDKVIREPNIRLLLDTAVYRVEKMKYRIDSVWARCDKTEHLYHVQATMFIDCTGDSRLGFEAGAEMRVGREPSSMFGESLADYDAPGTTQGSSILFTAREHDQEMYFEAPSWARSIGAEDLKHRSVGTESWEYGYWWIELGGIYDTIRDNELLRFELLAVVLGVWDHIKNSGLYPKSKNWALETVGMIPGKRDSRRLIGDTTLTQQHVQGDWKQFTDGVAFGGWSLDDHPAGGFDAKDRRPAQQINYDEPYNIPFGSLYSKNITNLLMAGRNVSASHVAFSSLRVMLTCAVIGQAAGTAAHQCQSKKITPRGLRNDSAHLQDLQQQLLRDGAHILGQENRDPRDLARSATVTASGSTGGTSPQNILSGRSYDKPNESAHRWMTKLDRDGAWIELTWDKPVQVGQIQITHDTGLHRDLTMTSLYWLQGEMLSGPQPETSRNYEVVGVLPNGSERQLAKVENNYQRLRRHHFDPLKLRSIRITVERGTGPEVGIYEVRAYEA
ncbi:MAG: FAD-dependent oxidoreductase [Opitutaceae bacterium]|nr:FAD-dependent oxidoreductase [Opitutaceae bacterium]